MSGVEFATLKKDTVGNIDLNDHVMMAVGSAGQERGNVDVPCRRTSEGYGNGPGLVSLPPLLSVFKLIQTKPGGSYGTMREVRDGGLEIPV